MPIFRKKPVEVEAIQIQENNFEELKEFLKVDTANSIVGHYITFDPASGCVSKVKVRTLEGTITAFPGDWIIKGIQGEFYLCKPDIFEATYTQVDWEREISMSAPKYSLGQKVFYFQEVARGQLSAYSFVVKKMTGGQEGYRYGATDEGRAIIYPEKVLFPSLELLQEWLHTQVDLLDLSLSRN